ncbi:MAG TPA: hypothetical protein VMN36_19110 [Verrucomicrobiales bacterium]|nr:hypothetical protein [Verrucomicrobiales bacterium]
MNARGRSFMKLQGAFEDAMDGGPPDLAWLAASRREVEAKGFAAPRDETV